MEIKKKRKVADFFKRFGLYIGAGVLVLALTITGLAIGLSSNQTLVPDDQDVSTTPLVFGLPMTNPEVIKDFSNTELQENMTLGWWEAHCAMDIVSQDGQVFAVLPGKVTAAGYNYDFGYFVTITSDQGFESTYASLDKQLLVNLNDTVEAGQHLGIASTSASNEELQQAHLHFTLKQNNLKVDPNNYIEFEKK